MERYHIYKLGLAILFYAVYYTRQTVVNGLKIEDVASTTNVADHRERRDAEGDNPTFYQGADGKPGVDFPTHSYVPRTTFSCKHMEAGYYADTETDCQVFHICDEGRKLSFLCPNGTVFQQAELICDWWYKVNCTTSPSLYEESAEILHKANAKRGKQQTNKHSYGTKQSVFQDFGRDNGEHHVYSGTPAQFVTPSYPYKPSIQNIDNRISASTEGSVRPNYNSRYDLRYDRKLDSFGNAVRESSGRTNQFSSGSSQNTFESNVHGKAEVHGGIQGTAGAKDRNGFAARGYDQAAYGTTTSRQYFGSGSYQTTASPRQNTFGLRNEGTFSSTRQDKFTFGNQQRSGSTHTAFGSRVQQQGTFGVTQQQPGSFGTNQYFSGSTLRPNQNVFDANIQRVPEIHNQNTYEGTASTSRTPFDTRPQNYNTNLQSSKTVEGADQAIDTRSQYYNNGNLQLSKTVQGNDKATDTRSQYYNNGNLQSSKTVQGNDQATDTRSQYYNNGNLQSSKTVQGNNQATDTRSQYYNNGNLQSSKTVQGNDQATDTRSQYYNNGNLQSSKTVQDNDQAISQLSVNRGSQQGFNAGLSTSTSNYGGFSSGISRTSQSAEANAFGTRQSGIQTTGGIGFGHHGSVSVSNQIPDKNVQQVSGRDRNVFNSETQSKTPIQTTFGANVPQTGLFSHTTSSQTSGILQGQPGVFSSHTFNTNVQGQAGRPTNTQQSAGVEYTTTFGTASLKTETGQNQNSFDTNLRHSQTTVLSQGEIGRNTYSASGAAPNTDSDKVRFSITPQDKLDTLTPGKQVKPGGYQQNVFGLQTDKPTPSTFGLFLQEDVGRIPVKVISAETQEPQETASFVTSSRNNLQASGKVTTANPYPNHRETYSEIKDPRQYYEKQQSKLPEKPFYGSSLSPQVLTTIPVSAYDGGFKATTEVNASPDRTRYSLGSRTDVSTTQKSSLNLGVTTFQQSTRFSQDGTGIDFSTSKTPSYSNKNVFGTSQTELGTHAGITASQPFQPSIVPSTVSPQSHYNSNISSNIDYNKEEINQSIKNTEQNNVQSGPTLSTVGLNKVDVSSYNEGFTNVPDVSLNVVSSTFRPDITSGKLTDKPSYYQGSTVTGISNYKSNEKLRTNSPLIKVNIIQSTPLPDFETVGRTGKAFVSESPKTQIILHGSKSSNKYLPTVSPYGIKQSPIGHNTFASIIAPPTPPTQDEAKFEDGKQSFDLSSRSTVSGNDNAETSTHSTATEAETVGFTINDEIYTTSTTVSDEFITISVNNQNYSAPASSFEVGGSVTKATPSKSDTSDILTSSSSGILQPKPFSTRINALPESNKIGGSVFGQTGTSQVPPYTISSASPFTTARPDDEELKTLTPTVPTPFTTESTYYSYQPTEENINNMINTLMEVVRQRLGGDGQFDTPRPGLVVPPSAGPQTLHSLAIYFANALDNLTTTLPHERSEAVAGESETDSPIYHIDNEELIKSLLTQMTLNNYEQLFKDQDATTTEASVTSRIDDGENDLIREDTKHPTEGPGVRQLARVFTEALSAYLEDPDTFKKVLHDVRPTEPPPLSGTENDEEEVLNYSDSDLKSDHPHLPIRPTGIPVSPTWGYLLALNKTSTDSDKLVSGNSISLDNENLQMADTQSFVPRYNKITSDYKTTLSVDQTVGTTEKSFTESEDDSDLTKALPQNHWTTSSDVTKLWQTTLSINPALLNENFDTAQTAGFTSDEIYGTKLTTSSDESTEGSTVVSEIQYELRALPKLELNSTQVHGILINFMNATRSEGSVKLQRILHKLNISQEEFLEKMKDIEANPLTRRLILLLISECNTDKNKELEIRSTSGDNVFSITESKVKSDQHEEDVEADREITTDSSSYKSIVHPSLDEDDEDTRALELLNSLYVIASKFGK